MQIARITQTVAINWLHNLIYLDIDFEDINSCGIGTQILDTMMIDSVNFVEVNTFTPERD